MKKTILHYIADYLPLKDHVFVFPSAIPAQFWAETAAVHTGNAVGMNRFVAWDVFKNETLSEKKKDLHPVNSAVRTMFVGNLLQENQCALANGTPLFQEIINPLYANNYESFVSSLAKILPQLDLFVRRYNNENTINNFYFDDLIKIHERYKDFLLKNNFYESAWNRIRFHENKKTWILFFPELADDWREYETELFSEAKKNPAKIIIIPLNSISESVPLIHQEKKFLDAQDIVSAYKNTKLIFSSFKDELSWLVMHIKKLLDCGISTEEIAVSVPALPDMIERLSLECKIHDVPVSIRQGKPLSNHMGGRIFSALANCSSSRWSFAALKNLLLDKSLPWKEKTIISELMEFGLKYRCMMGFQEHGKEIDVWEKSFDRVWLPDREKKVSLDVLKNFYLKLKKDIINIVEAKSFSEIKMRWRLFEDSYLVQEKIHDDVNKVMARIIKALDELIDVEENINNINIEKPYTIFLNYLREIEYVFQEENGGVPVYNYRAAAGISPLVHFIINVNQNDATVKSKSVSFLREDRQGMFGFVDRDLSSDFFLAYKLFGILSVFSVSKQTVNGPSVPHRMLSDHLENELPMKKNNYPDSYHYKEFSKSKQEDFRNTLVKNKKTVEIIKNKICNKKNEMKISPSDMNEYIQCPFRWMLQRGLMIKEKQTEIETIDQRDLGKLYHKILERFFLRIKNEQRFRAENLPQYKLFIYEETDKALNEARNREGAFQESVYKMLRERINAALSQYLDKDAENLNGCIIIGPEQALRRKFDGTDVLLSGISDLVAEDEDGKIILTDYKTGIMPAVSELLSEDNEIISNVQMAAYISMIEDSNKTTVKTARFYSLDNRDFRNVVSSIPPQRKNTKLPVEREAYQKEIDDVEILFKEIVDHMNVGNYFVPLPNERYYCNECRVSSVCRIPFSGDRL
jgi:hypothetical protein